MKAFCKTCKRQVIAIKDGGWWCNFCQTDFPILSVIVLGINKTNILGEGTLVLKNFGIDNTGLFLYNEGKSVELKLPLDAHKKRHRVIIEEIE